MMKNKSLKVPVIMIAIGLILSVVAYLFTSICQKPTITEHDFSYSITYRLDGEEKTINGVYNCRFAGFGAPGIDPLDRYYEGEHTIDGVKMDSRTYSIAKKDKVELYIVIAFNENYLMDDTKDESYAPFLEDPYLEAVSEESYAMEFGENELLDMFDAEIVSFEYPDPIENSFVFAKFGALYATNVLAMMCTGLLTLVICMILVKKEETVVYSFLDKFGILLNFAIFFLALPIVTLTAILIQMYPTGPDWIYQVDLCIPPMVLFSLAASVSLRRKGMKKSGFFIQFIGLAILVILVVLEFVF